MGSKVREIWLLVYHTKYSGATTSITRTAGGPYCYDTVVSVVGAVTPVRHVRDLFRPPDLNGLRPRLRLLASGHYPIHSNLLEWGRAR